MVEDLNNEVKSEGIDSGSTNTVETPEGSSNKMLVGTILVVVLVVAAVAAWFLYTPSGNETGAVAVVNGEEITRAEFNTQLQNLERVYESQGGVVSDSDRQDLVNSMVERELIIQYAEQNNISAPSSDVDEQYNQFVGQFGGEDEFSTFLEQQSLTEEVIRQDIRSQLTVQTVLRVKREEAGLDEITEEEVETRYNELVAEAGEDAEIPEFSVVEAQVRAQMEQEQQLAVYQEFVDELKEDADIEIMS